MELGRHKGCKGRKGNSGMKTKKEPYHDLLVWKIADKFTLSIYKITQRFPESEKYGLTSQLRRAAVSVPANIVEGQARQTDKEFRRFLYISRSSLAECSYLLSLAWRLGYIENDRYHKLNDLCRRSAYLLDKFIRSL